MPYCPSFLVLPALAIASPNNKRHSKIHRINRNFPLELRCDGLYV